MCASAWRAQLAKAEARLRQSSLKDKDESSGLVMWTYSGGLVNKARFTPRANPAEAPRTRRNLAQPGATPAQPWRPRRGPAQAC